MKKEKEKKEKDWARKARFLSASGQQIAHIARDQDQQNAIEHDEQADQAPNRLNQPRPPPAPHKAESGGENDQVEEVEVHSFD